MAGDYLIVILLIALGYLIGSINPAYIFGKTRGIDIRKYGSKNAGAANAWLVLGAGYGIATGIIDLLKGFLPIILAYNLNLQPVALILVAVSTILGHDFPFYLNFIGGRGLAVTYGASFALLGIFYKDIKLLLTLLVLLATCYFIISRIFVLPYRQRKKTKQEIKIWRKVLRFLALIFPITYLLFGKTVPLILLIIATSIFIFIEISRFLSKKALKNIVINSLFKKQEKRKISGIFLFLISCLFILVFFEKNIAILVLSLFIIGDNLAEIIGINYGRIKLIGNKTLEGSFACFSSCFFTGLLLTKFLPITFFKIFVTSSIISLIELFSYRIDDNLTIPIITAFLLKILNLNLNINL